MSGGERRLAAIMFTDLVGYTRLAQADEKMALRLLDEHRALLRPVFASHGGTEVKTIGDGFLLEFRSALDAVECAVELQKKMTDRNSGGDPSGKLELRVGIHLGDVVHGAGDVHGDAVNVASRIEPLALPGGACITQQVYDSIRNKTSLDFTRMGEINLKNVELPVMVYRINMSWSAQSRAEGPAPRERLAVLPFVNISPDPNDEYFADGLTEELISKLAEISSLKVIARTSVMNYKKKEKKASEIGRELGVGSIIEGSVRKAGTKIRVTVQLIDANSEEHLWASNYDKEMDDIFAIQSDVASKVASSLKAGVFSGVRTKDTEDLEAYTQYIRGVQLVHEGSEEGLRAGLALLETAVARDPKFARAYASLGFAWGALASSGYEDFSKAKNAEEAAARALELDPNCAEAHSSMALAHSLMDRFPDAIAEAEAALRLNPSLAGAHTTLGIQYASAGDLEKSIGVFRKGYEIDPLSFAAGNMYSLTLRTAGHHQEAVAVLEQMRKFMPHTARIYVGLAECYMFVNDFAKAQEYLDQAAKINPNEPLMILGQGTLYAFTGRREEAEKTLARVNATPTESVRLFGELFINASLGRLDPAFKALDRMAVTHSWPFLLKTLPVFKELRADPRFSEFCAKIGLKP
ncbi:MAG: tetratricopeptide repeat protein [archaeon]|nr:MAG: tetratricopeptide repeat protein [archaeon]